MESGPRKSFHCQKVSFRTMAAEQISLKLLVHKKQNQVIYAESGKDFVDVLFSFLTMPVGTAVRLAGKQSKMGSISTLYESVEDLDMEFLQTEACKDMLLHPKSVVEEWRKNLIVDIDDTKPTEYYACSQGYTCYAKTHCLISTVDTARCPCGFLMKTKLSKGKSKVVAHGEDGVFVKGKKRFMISDDLKVSPVSTKETLTLLNKLGITDMTVLEERDVNVGGGEVLHLLKCLLLSKTTLTNVFLRGQDPIDKVDQDFKVMSLDSKDMPHSLTERKSDSDCKKMSVKLFLSKSNKKVLFAECGEEFADLLFSFLAFPLGSILKVSGGFPSLICLNNLYNSVQLLSVNSCIISENSKDMLLDPKLAPYFSCDMQPIQIQEQVPWQPTILWCAYCYGNDYYIADDGPNTCPHGCKRVQLSTINPKFPNAVEEPGGAFTAGPATFMVTDELNVKPFSPTSVILLLSKFNICISDLEERVARVGEEEALSLLKSSLISRTALSDAFILKKPKKFAVGSHKRRFVVGSHKRRFIVGSYKRRAASARDVKTKF